MSREPKARRRAYQPDQSRNGQLHGEHLESGAKAFGANRVPKRQERELSGAATDIARADGRQPGGCGPADKDSGGANEMNGIHTSRGEALRQSRAVVERAEPSKGLEADANKPLMRKRTGNEPSAQVILPATLSAGTLAGSGRRGLAASRAVNANANERGPHSRRSLRGADSCLASSDVESPHNPTGHGKSPTRAAEQREPDSAPEEAGLRGQANPSPVGRKERTNGI